MEWTDEQRKNIEKLAADLNNPEIYENPDPKLAETIRKLVNHEAPELEAALDAMEEKHKMQQKNFHNLNVGDLFVTEEIRDSEGFVSHPMMFIVVSVDKIWDDNYAVVDSHITAVPVNNIKNFCASLHASHVHKLKS